MKISLFRGDALENQREKVAKALQLSPQVSVELALDSIHGLNELARSLAQLHPHKKSIAIIAGQPPPLQELVSGFAADGFTIQELPFSFINPNEKEMKQAFENLKKDTLFILSAAVEPLTGVFYPFDFIRREAPKKNIFSVTYFSPDALKRGFILPENPFEGVIVDPLWSDRYTLTIVLKGERCQGERLLWGKPHFSDEAIDFLLARLEEIKKVETSLENKKLVTEIEARVAASVTRGLELLNLNISRLYDRAVFFVEGAHGDAFVKKIAERGFEVHTGAACTWNQHILNNWLPKLGIPADKVQTSVLVPLATLTKSHFFEAFIETIKDLRKISNFKE